MSDTASHRAFPLWTWLAPLLAGVLLAAKEAGMLEESAFGFVLLAPPLLVATVFAAVNHAEMVAVRVGEVIGVIVLGLSVTSIEVSLIASVMLEESTIGPQTVARDTVFAGVMVLLNGIVGLSLLVGGLRFREQRFELQGTASALAVLGTLACVAMILPTYTVARPGPVYSGFQLLFVAVSSLLLCCLFLFVQSVSQRAYFTPVEVARVEHPHVSTRTAVIAGGLLLASLVAVVLLADGLAPAVQIATRAAGLPEEIVGVVIALLVLMPEGATAIRAAGDNRVQTSLNLALGSAIQSTGFTLPAIALFATVKGLPLELGLSPEHVILLALTLFISTLTLSTGRTTLLQGAVHLSLFAVFLLIAAVP